MSDTIYYIDTEEMDNLDGTIEPLTIRDGIIATGDTLKTVVHTVRGELEAGNPDPTNFADVVLSIDEVSSNYSQRPFVDQSDQAVAGTSMILVHEWRRAPIIPFDDHDNQGIRIDPESEHMRSQIEAMDPDTDNYVPYGSVSQRCGFMLQTYDSIVGTDSIAFEGYTSDPGSEMYVS